MLPSYAYNFALPRPVSKLHSSTTNKQTDSDTEEMAKFKELFPTAPLLEKDNFRKPKVKVLLLYTLYIIINPCDCAIYPPQAQGVRRAAASSTTTKRSSSSSRAGAGWKEAQSGSARVKPGKKAKQTGTKLLCCNILCIGRSASGCLWHVDV